MSISVHLASGDCFRLGFAFLHGQRQRRRIRVQSSLGCFISSCVMSLGVGVGQRKFDDFWDRAKVWLDPPVVWTAHSRHLTTCRTPLGAYPFREPRAYDCPKGSGFALRGAKCGSPDASHPIPSDQRRHAQNGEHSTDPRGVSTWVERTRERQNFASCSRTWSVAVGSAINAFRAVFDGSR